MWFCQKKRQYDGNIWVLNLLIIFSWRVCRLWYSFIWHTMWYGQSQWMNPFPNPLFFGNIFHRHFRVSLCVYSIFTDTWISCLFKIYYWLTNAWLHNYTLEFGPFMCSVCCYRKLPVCTYVCRLCVRSTRYFIITARKCTKFVYTTFSHYTTQPHDLCETYCWIRI